MVLSFMKLSLALSCLGSSLLSAVGAVPQPLERRSVAGPAINHDFPDPALIWVPSENTWYAFATNGDGKHIRIAKSADFNNWNTNVADPLPRLGSWAAQSNSNVWAPMVMQLDNGSFVMYYSATSASTGSHCIGVATSGNAAGPYTPRSESFACHADQGGAIDAAGHRAPDGTFWVVYKVDGNNKGHGGSCNNGNPPIVSTPIMLQQVAADGFTHIGSPRQILDRDDGDGPLVEAPSLIHVGNYWFLFFSSGCYAENTYDLSYATATSVTGPYTKARAPNAPLLVTGSYGLKAPGSATFAKDGSKVVFHAFLGNDINSGRGMWTGVPTFSGNTVKL
jgi:beta-xylosidase